MSEMMPTNPDANDEHVLLNVQEAAAFLRLTRSTLDHYRCEGKGPNYRKHGTRVFYTRASLIDWSGRREFSSTSSRAGKSR
ncbi:helix-turn-helix domain-containing protein [Hyphomonas sp.]|uniref:helix-turn-helix transcriptional regulator n=1 Tax=Hyphomonas sp. TaxID=87 RepID=UPI0025C4B968|nr:helix-turn-helix domain-containing protein [Hyphomonas sp.]